MKDLALHDIVIVKMSMSVNAFINILFLKKFKEKKSSNVPLRVKLNSIKQRHLYWLLILMIKFSGWFNF